jgi:thiol-disulfide isomerase/thioredoxin
MSIHTASAQREAFSAHRRLLSQALGLGLGSSLMLSHKPAHSVQPSANPEQAQDFTLAGSQGPLQLSRVEGALVYLDFWASWCAPCKLSFPWMQAMHERYQESGLVILAICLDKDSREATAFLQQAKPRFSILFDEQATTPQRYDIKAMPSSFFIRPKSLTMLHKHAGFRSQDQAALERLIQSFLQR